jgi:hypothetical protein
VENDAIYIDISVKVLSPFSRPENKPSNLLLVAGYLLNLLFYPEDGGN